MQHSLDAHARALKRRGTENGCEVRPTPKGVDDIVTTSQVANSLSKADLRRRIASLFTGQLPIALDNVPSEIYGRILCLRHAFLHRLVQAAV